MIILGWLIYSMLVMEPTYRCFAAQIRQPDASAESFRNESRP
jgi:hypothetical protein